MCFWILLIRSERKVQRLSFSYGPLQHRPAAYLSLATVEGRQRSSGEMTGVIGRLLGHALVQHQVARLARTHTSSRSSRSALLCGHNYTDGLDAYSETLIVQRNGHTALQLWLFIKTGAQLCNLLTFTWRGCYGLRLS